MLPGSENERYVDNVGKKSFAFDHLTFVSLCFAFDLNVEYLQIK